MKRTSLLRPYLAKIDSLNDQLWYFLFTTKELNSIISRFSTSAQKGFTTDLFFKNPYSKRLHIRVSELIDHQNNNKRLTFGAYFSTCYEITSNYIRDVFDELKSCNSLTGFNWGDGKKPEMKLKTLLTTHRISLPLTIYLIV